MINPFVRHFYYVIAVRPNNIQTEYDVLPVDRSTVATTAHVTWTSKQLIDVVNDARNSVWTATWSTTRRWIRGARIAVSLHTLADTTTANNLAALPRFRPVDATDRRRSIAMMLRVGAGNF